MIMFNGRQENTLTIASNKFYFTITGNNRYLGLLVGTLTMVDYYGFGIAMVLIFYLFRGDSWWHRAGQLLGLYWINAEMMGGLVYEFELFGRLWVIHQQSFALLALIFIWLYRGRKGHSSKAFQYFCYAFYPVHVLILGLLR